MYNLFPFDAKSLNIAIRAVHGVLGGSKESALKRIAEKEIRDLVKKGVPKSSATREVWDNIGFLTHSNSMKRSVGKLMSEGASKESAVNRVVDNYLKRFSREKVSREIDQIWDYPSIIGMGEAIRLYKLRISRILKEVGVSKDEATRRANDIVERYYKKD